MKLCKIVLAAAAAVGAVAATDSASALEDIRMIVTKEATRPALSSLRASSSRRMQDADPVNDATWACAADEDPTTSCCDAVPRVFGVFNTTACAPSFGLAALALGIQPSDTPFPAAAVPSTPAEIASSVASFCPSVCGLALRAVVADYASRPPAGRLCPQVFDGLWRLGLVCDTDPDTGGACLAAYAGVHRAFERGLGGNRAGGASPSSAVPDTPPELRALCNSTCLRHVKDAASAAAGRIGSALVVVDGGGSGDATLSPSSVPATPSPATTALLEYAFRRAAAVTRMADLVCTRDPEGGAFCVLKTRVFARSAEADVGAAVIAPAPPAQTSSPQRRRRLDDDGADDDDDGADAADGRRGAAETDDASSSDDLATVLNPRSRPGFACSFCGRAVLSAYLDLADVFGVPLPGGDRALTVARARALLLDGCGVDGASGKSCLQLYASSSPASSSYSPSLGLAALGLQLCAPAFAAGFAPGTCSEQCAYALAVARSAFGCCLPAHVAMTAAVGDLALPDGPGGAPADALALLRAAASSCTALDGGGNAAAAAASAKGSCSAALRRFVAPRFRNVRPAWVLGSPSRRAAFASALALDLARTTGHASSVFTLESLVTPADGSTVAVIGVLAPSNASSVDVVRSTRALLASGAASFPNLAALVATDPLRALVSPALAAPVAADDASALYAPAPRPPTEDVTSGADAHKAAARGAVGVAVAVAAVAVSAAMVM